MGAHNWIRAMELICGGEPWGSGGRMTDGRGTMGTVNDRTSVGGGQGTGTEGVVDRVLKARAGMWGEVGREESGGIE